MRLQACQPSANFLPVRPAATRGEPRSLAPGRAAGGALAVVEVAGGHRTEPGGACGPHLAGNDPALSAGRHEPRTRNRRPAGRLFVLNRAINGLATACQPARGGPLTLRLLPDWCAATNGRVVPDSDIPSVDPVGADKGGNAGQGEDSQRQQQPPPQVTTMSADTCKLGSELRRAQIAIGVQRGGEGCRGISNLAVFGGAAELLQCLGIEIVGGVLHQKIGALPVGAPPDAAR
jgi:hypothetical protein